MLERIRRAAVQAVKPRVSESTWQTMRSVAPRRRRGRRTRLHLDQVGPALTGVRRDVAASVEDWALAQRDLPSLAARFGTDKWGLHRYAAHYEHHVGHLKKERFTLLEIGIGGYRADNTGGASLRMWKHFFTQAQIYGLDIYDKSFVDEDRITTFQGSQADEMLLRRIAKQARNLRVIIDDGSHRPEHVRATFAVLFPKLADGGFYAIEDTQTSYWPGWGGSLDLQDPTTTMALVKDLIDGLNYEEIGDQQPRSYFDTHVVGVHCYHNLVIIEKGDNREGTRRSARWNTVR